MTENVAIPQVHLDMLKEDPDGFSLGFDHKYGEGAASRVLNAEAPSMTEEAQPGYQANSPNRDRTMVGKVWNNTGGAVLHGAQEGFNEMVDTFGDLDDWYAKRTRELGIPAYLEFGYDTEGDRGFVLEFVHRPEQGTMFFGGEGEEETVSQQKDPTTNLTSTETALLSPTEKVIASRT
jgi:hypothetical protein